MNEGTLRQDLPLEAEPKAETPKPDPVERLAGLTRMLRVVGGALLLVAASAFLLQRWEAGNDLARYATLFGLTAALSVAGLFCAQGLGEGKAARAFLALSLFITPVHAAVLGALLYSRFSWDGIAGDLPAFGVWVAPSDLAAWATPAIALLLLAPIVYLANRALAPGQAGALSGLVLLTHLPLVIPLRGSEAMAMVLTALSVLLLWHELSRVRRVPVLRTPEGRWVRLLLAAPMFVVAGRVLLYSPEQLFLGTVCLLGAGWLFLLVRRMTTDDETVAVLQWLSVAPAAFGWWLVATAMEVLPAAELPLLALPFSALLALASTRVVRGGAAMRGLGAALAVSSMTVNVVGHPSVGAALGTILVGLLAVAYAFVVEGRTILALGVVGGLVGTAYQVGFALEAYTWSRWGGLAILGAATLLAAAFLERYRAELQPWARRVARRLRGWTY